MNTEDTNQSEPDESSNALDIDLTWEKHGFNEATRSWGHVVGGNEPGLAIAFHARNDDELVVRVQTTGFADPAEVATMLRIVALSMEGLDETSPSSDEAE